MNDVGRENRELFLRAVTAHREERLSEAAQLYQQILTATPDHGDALHLLGVIEATWGHSQAAFDLINRSLTVNPGDGHALNDLGMVLVSLGNPEAAMGAYDKASEAIPGDPYLLSNRGVALCALERFGEALECFDGALAARPDDSDVLTNRGNALHRLTRHHEALESYDRALALAPEDGELLNNRGNALYELRRYEEAVDCFARAIAAKPDHAEAYVNYGNLLDAMQRYDEALESYDQALAIDPEYVNAIFNRGVTLQRINQMDRASADFKHVFTLDPNHNHLIGWLHNTKAHCCDWDGYDDEVSRITNEVRAGKHAALPWHFFAISQSPRDQLVCAQTWATEKCPVSPNPIWHGERYAHDRIRVAYVSADFHDHPLAHLMAGLFEHHDLTRFETIAISFGPANPGPTRTRLENAFDQFIDVRFESDRDIALLLRELEVDIAIDRKGFTLDSRPGIFAQRPAPVQVNYLAYPGTMGAPFIDYIIADKFIIPEDDRKHYAEEVVYLPHSYQANDRNRPISDHTMSRTEAGLPEKGFVFCCFNNNYKLNPTIFDTWMTLLTAVEGSVLWLLEANDASAANLRHEAENRGVSANRLVFAAHLPNPDHLARLRLADLCLDNLPFNAHTTASDALWAGLPIITCQGTTFAGRVSTGLLNAVGLPELVTHSLDEYRDLALALARDPTSLAGIREKLAVNLKTQPLYDTDLYRRHLEAAFETMWERYQRGEPPKGFSVPEHQG
jgi:predicted O-linked N-acetylglucosamine transferase (SPINDLY family)